MNRWRWSMVAALCLASSSATALALDLFETTDSRVDEGNALLAAGKPADALKAYEVARVELPESPLLHLATGLAQAGMGDFAAATQSLSRALERAEGPVYGMVLYNLGTAYARWAQELEKTAQAGADPKVAIAPTTPPAMNPSGGSAAPAPGAEAAAGDPAQKAKTCWQKAEYYLERAVIERPSDAHALRNLEIALLRVDPPCYARNDPFEPNDQPDQAKPFPFAANPAAGPNVPGAPVVPGAPPVPGASSPPTGAPPGTFPSSGQPSAQTSQVDDGSQRGEVNLVLCAEDRDWFAVDLQPGERLSASVESQTPEAGLALSLYEATGQTRLRPPADSSTSLQKFDYRAGNIAQTVLIRVDNAAAVDCDFVLKVRLLPDCRALEDSFEDNDTGATATSVTAENREALQNLRLCPGDEDDFSVNLEPGESLVALLHAKPEQGKPALDILDDKGMVVARSQWSQDSLSDETPTVPPPTANQDVQAMAVLLEPPAGRYVVRVGGSIDAEAAYGLDLQVVPACPQGNDPLEPNNKREEAKPVERDKPQLLRVCEGDEDWLSVDLQPNERLQATIQFDHERGDLALESYTTDQDKPTEVSNRSTTQSNGEALALVGGTAAEKRQLRVFSQSGGQNFYLLQVKAPQPNDQSGNQDQKKDQNQDQQSSSNEQKDQKQSESPQPQNPLEDDMQRQDRNPRNLQAEQVRRMMPPHFAEPEQDW